MLGAAQSQSKVKWMSDGADIVGARKAELEDDLDAKPGSKSKSKSSIAGQADKDLGLGTKGLLF